MRGLIDAGIEIDIYPIYPVDATLWRYVPDVLSEKVLPRSKVHHLTITECLWNAEFWTLRKIGSFLSDTLSITASALRYGVEPVLKSNYVFLKAWVWACQYRDAYDHVLAYWGNYAASSAYLFHRMANPTSSFSLFLHAGLDLYRIPVFMRKKLLYADNIITCSDFNARFIRERYSNIADRLTNKIYVHHHGLDLGEFAFQTDGRSPRRVVAVGRLEKEKGFDYLIKATHKLKSTGVDIEVEIVGDGSEGENLKALSNDLGLNDRVTFRGWVTPDQSRTIMQRACMLVHPSSYLGDGVPNVIKESMALGTPVVATAVAGIPELLDDGRHGIVVPPQDVEALAKAINVVLSDGGRVQTLIQSARKYVEEKFDMRINGQQLADFIRSRQGLRCNSASKA
jgi:glycosyltransferase involved in cell wall biosynthesis